MKESSAETLTALYPLENRRLLRNYANFVESNPDWLELGFSFFDYKRKQSIPGLQYWTDSSMRERQGGSL